MSTVAPLFQNSESSYYSPKSSIGSIQVALVAITLVGGVTATFALIGYLPALAVWPGAVGGGVAFFGFAIISVKQCCKEEYVFEAECRSASHPEVSYEESVSIIESSKSSERIFEISESKSDIQEEPVDTRSDPFSRFPSEISLLVLRILDMRSLCIASRVCRQWRVLAQDQSLWQLLYQQVYGPALSGVSDWKRECLHPFLRELEEEKIFSENLEKGVKPFIKKRELPRGVIDRLHLTDSKLLFRTSNKSGVVRRELEKNALLDLNEGMFVDGVFLKSTTWKDHALVIGSEFISLIDFDTVSCKWKEDLRREGFERNFQDEDENYLYLAWISPSSRQILKMLDKRSLESQEITIPCRKINNEYFKIIGLQEWKNHLVCCYGDGVREIWNMTTHEKISDLILPRVHGQRSCEAYLIVQNQEFILDCFGKRISIHHMETGESSEYSLGKKCRFLKYHKGIVIVGESVLGKLHERLYFFDLETQNWLKTIKLEKEQAYSYFFHVGHLLLGSSEGELSVWKLNSGECLLRDTIKAPIWNIYAKGAKIAVSFITDFAILDFSQEIEIEDSGSDSGYEDHQDHIEKNSQDIEKISQDIEKMSQDLDKRLEDVRKDFEDVKNNFERTAESLVLSEIKKRVQNIRFSKQKKYFTL